LLEDLAGKVVELMGADLTHGHVLCATTRLCLQGQCWVSQQLRGEGLVDQGAADRSINPLSNWTLVE
jgi:hypothetical protein